MATKKKKKVASVVTARPKRASGKSAPARSKVQKKTARPVAAAKRAAKKAANRPAKKIVRRPTKVVRRPAKVVRRPTKAARPAKTSKKSAKKVVRRPVVGARRPAKKAVKRPVKKVVKRPAKAVKRPAKKAAKRPVKKVVKRPAKVAKRPAKVAKKVAKRPVKKVAKKPAKVVKRPAKVAKAAKKPAKVVKKVAKVEAKKPAKRVRPPRRFDKVDSQFNVLGAVPKRRGQKRGEWGPKTEEMRQRMNRVFEFAKSLAAMAEWRVRIHVHAYDEGIVDGDISVDIPADESSYDRIARMVRQVVEGIEDSGGLGSSYVVCNWMLRPEVEIYQKDGVPKYKKFEGALRIPLHFQRYDRLSENAVTALKILRNVIDAHDGQPPIGFILRTTWAEDGKLHRRE